MIAPLLAPQPRASGGKMSEGIEVDQTEAVRYSPRMHRSIHASVRTSQGRNQRDERIVQLQEEVADRNKWPRNLSK